MAVYRGLGQQQSNNALLAGGTGFAAGVTLDQAAMTLKSAKSRANWGLGIAVALTALAAVSSSDLNNDQASAAATIATASGLSFTSTPTGLEVAALRSVVIQQGFLLNKIAYDASLFSFQGSPTPPVTTVQIAAITQTAAVAQQNSNVIILALAVLAVLAIVMMN